MLAAAALAAAISGGLTWQTMSAEVVRVETQGQRSASEARSEGYSDGYREALAASSGTAADSYQDGYDDGRDAGYDEGYDAGFTAGQDAGAGAGYDESAPDWGSESGNQDATSPWASGEVWTYELEYGTTDSDSVRHLQWALQQLGYDLDVTGNYLDQTDLVVREWQSSIGNKPDPVGSSSVGLSQAERLFADYPGIDVW